MIFLAHLKICWSILNFAGAIFEAKVAPTKDLRQPRLHIPDFRNLFLGPKKTFLPGFLRIFFFLCFPEEFFTGTWFWRWLQEFLFFAAVTGIFCRNSCGTGIPVFTLDSSGFLRIPPDSSGFLFPPKLSGSSQRLKKALC
jgi:hypothetical protein